MHRVSKASGIDIDEYEDYEVAMAMKAFYLRGEAYLQRGSFPDAVQQYEQILQHRGVDPFAPVVPLAQLGVARAKARIGDVEGSGRAYEALFTIWSGADPDFAPLVAARAEYARLHTH